MNLQEPLDIDRIGAARKETRIGRKVVVFRSTASTNDIAREYAANPDSDGLCELAESQYNGELDAGERGFSNRGKVSCVPSC